MLLRGITATQHWRREFIPVVLKLIGHTVNPWYIRDADFVHILQVAWDDVFGGTMPLVVAVNDEVYTRVCLEIHS